MSKLCIVWRNWCNILTGYLKAVFPNNMSYCKLTFKDKNVLAADPGSKYSRSNSCYKKTKEFVEPVTHWHANFDVLMFVTTRICDFQFATPSSLVTFDWHSEGGYSASINRVEEFALSMATVVSVMSINSCHLIRRQVPQDSNFYWIIWRNANLLSQVEGNCWRENGKKFYSVAIMQDQIAYSRRE